MHGLTIAGFCLCITGAMLSFRRYLPSAKSVGPQGDRAPDQYTNAIRQDSYQGTLWLGVALMVVSQVVQQMERGAPADELAFSLVAAAAMVFICGLYAGRLMLRRQWRLEAAAERGS